MGGFVGMGTVRACVWPVCWGSEKAQQGDRTGTEDGVRGPGGLDRQDRQGRQTGALHRHASVSSLPALFAPMPFLPSPHACLLEAHVFFLHL